MIQEKDFLYRVPVKTAPITTPGGQIRNPEILVDLEGGEFMHGNILDANSTNKLINQSVKEAVDNNLNESGCVTKDLLEAETTRATEQENSLKTLIDAETSARTKGDEDLGSKIKAEQTRAEGKEKEISDKLAIVNGDSNTEGSFRKAIADVVAAAPEDLDTLKEIADKLAGNDDLHTALNQAITEKADASALANEVSRATGAESGLQAAIATKADATALSNYVLTTALNKQVDTLNAAISAKQDAGNYIPYNAMVEDSYQIDKVLDILTDNGTAKFGPQTCIEIQSNNGAILRVQPTSLYGKNGDTSISINAGGISLTDNDSIIRLSSGGVILPYGDNNRVLTSNGSTINIGEYATQRDLSAQLAPKANRSDLTVLEQKITANTTAIEGKQDKGNYIAYSSKDNNGYTIDNSINFVDNNTTNKTRLGAGFMTVYYNDCVVKYSSSGIDSSRFSNCLATSDGTFKPISDFVLKTELPTKTSQLTNDSNFITADHISNAWLGIKKDLKIYDEDTNMITTISHGNIRAETKINDFVINQNGFFVSRDNDGTNLCTFTPSGITFEGKTNDDIPTANGSFIELSSLASAEDISSLRVGLSKKQNKITVNTVDITDIETADVTKLRTIVANLINALISSGLINATDGIE